MLNELPQSLEVEVLKALNKAVKLQDSDLKDQIRGLKDKIADLETDLTEKTIEAESLAGEIDAIERNIKIENDDIKGIIKWALTEGADPLNATSFVSLEMIGIIYNQTLTTHPKADFVRKIDYRPQNYQPPLGMKNLAARGKMIELD